MPGVKFFDHVDQKHRLPTTSISEEIARKRSSQADRDNPAWLGGVQSPELEGKNCKPDCQQAIAQGYAPIGPEPTA